MTTTTAISRFSAGRFLQCLAVGGPGAGGAAFAEAQNWADRAVVVQAVRAAVAVVDTNDFPPALAPVADAFISAMRGHSVPLRLPALRRVPLQTRILVSGSTGRAIEVPEGAPIPVLRGIWTATTLRPRKFGAISAQTLELMRNTSAGASAAITDDLAQATSEVENLAFVSPDVAGSVLNGAANFPSTGSTAAAISDDLRSLLSLVRSDGGGGLALVMHEATATFIHFSDPAKFPAIGPQGGTLAGIPVLISNEACERFGSPTERIVGLINASQIFWADRGRVELSVTREAALQMLDDPSAGATNIVSMFQSDSAAAKAVRESSWFARAGAGAYLVVPY